MRRVSEYHFDESASMKSFLQRLMRKFGTSVSKIGGIGDEFSFLRRK